MWTDQLFWKPATLTPTVQHIIHAQRKQQRVHLFAVRDLLRVRHRAVLNLHHMLCEVIRCMVCLDGGYAVGAYQKGIVVHTDAAVRIQLSARPLTAWETALAGRKGAITGCWGVAVTGGKLTGWMSITHYGQPCPVSGRRQWKISMQMII